MADFLGFSATPARRRLFAAALLAFLVAGVFWPTLRQPFITYDDPVYVTQNPHVTSGLTWANLKWAFGSTTASNWHPLTWISHMADCELYGLRPAGHHFTSVCLHVLNTVLLFLLFARSTGRPWCSVMVAALFGLHPLHVESVAWIAERKDVLSTTFWILVLLVYVRRAERLGSAATGLWALYCAALGLFALGLMAKPMLVTLPGVLVLLDFWPLTRWQNASRRGRWVLVIEKVPFLLLSAAASAVTLFAQKAGGAVASVDDFTIGTRIGNAVIAYVRYLGKCFYPADLSIFYPNFAQQPAPLVVLAAAALLIGIAAVGLLGIRRWPSLLFGYLWYLGTLVPVIGLVQVGGQAIADRYTYVPLIGIFVSAVWVVADASANWRRQSLVVGGMGVTLVATMIVLTSRQIAYWKDGVTLFRHSAAVTQNNWVAHHNLFLALAKDSPAEAQAELNETLRILADFAGSYEKRGIELAKAPEKQAEAIAQFRTAIRIMRTLPGPHYNLGLALAQIPEQKPAAIEELQTAVELAPGFAEAHFALAYLLSDDAARSNDAILSYRRAISLNPQLYQARFNLGMVLVRLPGREQEALEQFQEALKTNSEFKPAREMLDWMLEGRR